MTAIEYSQQGRKLRVVPSYGGFNVVEPDRGDFHVGIDGYWAGNGTYQVDHMRNYHCNEDGIPDSKHIRYAAGEAIAQLVARGMASQVVSSDNKSPGANKAYNYIAKTHPELEVEPPFSDNSRTIRTVRRRFMHASRTASMTVESR